MRATIGAAEVDLVIHAGDLTLSAEFVDLVMTGAWTLLISPSYKDAPIITHPMTVASQTVSYTFSLQELTDLFPDDGTVLTATKWCGVYTVAQDDIPRLAGKFTALATALHGTI